MLDNPKFVIGENVVVQFKEDDKIHELGIICSGEHIEGTGWRYFIYIGLDPKPICYYEKDIIKIDK